MPAGRDLIPETWTEYLDAVSRELPGAPVSIEITEASGTRRHDHDGLVLEAVGYDGRQDIFELALARRSAGGRDPRRLRHVVTHPRRLATDSHTLLAPMTISVDGENGESAVIRVERELDELD